MSSQSNALTKDEVLRLYALAASVKAGETTVLGTATALRITRSRSGALRFVIESETQGSEAQRGAR